ncbi:related to GCD7-translation initiation factor eIF2b, 43 kDa subunit [Sporisorium reilianum SRZ2]|uniref:Translation initiation factor eIF2B subunit beta n=1 Tax=Sporisorium reilianum (strain SRZ2) TaxID=999809 RepID=E6ZT44_SPORE|nr:related to GCD7-translation initiation factor eIF2b, 43 kDa subunit [Sporisorium reilianum SRZ2]
MTAATPAALAGTGSLPTPKLTHQAPFETIIKDKSSQKLIISLSLRLRRGQISGPEAVSEATAKALRSVVSSAKYNSMQELIDIIKAAGRQLQLSQPAEQSIGNITRRVVHLLREEAKAALLEAHEKEMGGNGRRSAGSGSGINSLSNSISDLHLASAFGGAAASAIPSHVMHSQSPSASGSASSSSNSVPQLPSHAARSSTSHSQFPSSSSSAGAGTHSPMTRPGPYPLRTGSESTPGSSSAFVHGSFSISDLVAAGAMATSTSSSLAHTPADGSYVSTPHASLSRKGSGVFDSSLAQLSQQMSGVSLTEDAAGEAEAEEAMHSGKAVAEEDNSEEDDDDDEDEDEEDDDEEVDTSKLITGKKSAGAYFLKPLLIQAIQDLIDELETVDDNIAKVSRDHIHSGEVILTLGASATVQGFFASAAKDRKFTVIVPETAPSYSGHTLARALAKSGISVLLIPDASIFAVLPRVSKVVLGAHAVLANGGLISAAGSYATALAARQHSTPVMILTGVYKICPEWSSIQTFANASGSVGALGPAALLDYATSSSIVQHAEVVTNAFDYVPPHLVDVFITNVGEHPPSYVYRLVKENYHQDDIVL